MVVLVNFIDVMTPCQAMNNITRILKKMEKGEPEAADQLLPQVYIEMRKLAAAKLANEQPGLTLQSTALVHEADLRLVKDDEGSNNKWNGSGHFFGAAAEAMRRILVENARRRKRLKHGGGMQRHDADSKLVSPETDDKLVALDKCLDRLAVDEPEHAELVKLRYFAGMTQKDAAAALGVSRRKADSMWAFAKVWLQREIEAL